MKEELSFIKDTVKIPFAMAVDIAEMQIDGGKVLSGRLGVVQGFLTYGFFVVIPDSATAYIVLVDAYNGSVLYVSDKVSVGDLQFMSLPFGPAGANLGHGWPMKPRCSGPVVN